LVGFTKQFNHLDGHEVTVEQQSVTKPGQIIKIAGEGMPHFNYPSDKGDLYIEFSIIMPESVTEHQKSGLFYFCFIFVYYYFNFFFFLSLFFSLQTLEFKKLLPQ